MGNKSASIVVPFKMLYRYKVAIFAGVLAAFTLFIAYVTGPKNSKTPQIRVIFISHSDHSAVKRSLSSSSFLTYDDSVQCLDSEDGSVTVDRTEWDLASAGDFFQNNIVLECSSSFPVTWKYLGYGNPSVSETNMRIHGDFNDTTTFSYISLLNLMPITEKSTGKYICLGGNNETSHISTSVHLFVPGGSTFLIDFDTTIESPGEDHIIVPCPVTNSSANISLYFKNQALSSNDNLFTFDPKVGFHLSPKFVEEQAEPWGQFFCENSETAERSGIITIQPAKGLIVNAVPETSTVLLSKETSNENPNEKFKFVCQAKEEITLKFLKVVRNPMVMYEYNSSSMFPFSAYTEVNTKHFRNLSRIYCRTVRSNEDLHSWKVLFSSLSLVSEVMSFYYDSSREDFACCSPSNKRSRLTLLPCDTISECRVKGHCLLPGHQCKPGTTTVLPERAGCVRYKLMQTDDQNDKQISKRKLDGNEPGEIPTLDKIVLESGLLQCSIEGKDEEKVFFAVRSQGENGTLLSTLTGSNAALAGPTQGSSRLEIIELQERKSGSGRKRFLCRGAKFFVAVGFIWQSVSFDDEIRYHVGRDTVNGAWIKSQLDLATAFQSRSKSWSKIKRIYCIAPLWNSEKGEWVNVKLDVIA